MTRVGSQRHSKKIVKGYKRKRKFPKSIRNDSELEMIQARSLQTFIRGGGKSNVLAIAKTLRRL
jgi:hypothetical protein